MEFVKAKNLVEGKVYIAGRKEFFGTELEGWRETFIYLGRTDNGGFIWGFVGAPKIYKEDPVKVANKYLSQSVFTGSITVTQNNKKVSELTFEDFLDLNDYILNYDDLSDEVKEKIERTKKFR